MSKTLVPHQIPAINTTKLHLQALDIAYKIKMSYFPEFDSICFNVEYLEGKKRRFIVQKNLVDTYVKLIATIKSKLPYLYNSEVCIQYKLDDEWFILNHDDMEVRDIIYKGPPKKQDQEYSTLKLKVSEGQSPQVSGPSSRNTAKLTMTPKKLQFCVPSEETAITSGMQDTQACRSDEKQDIPHNPDEEMLEKFHYSPPIDKTIESIETKVEQKQYALDLATAAFESFNELVHPQLDEDQTKQLCGNCHLREGHNKSKCPSKPQKCESAKYCGQLQHHPSETHELSKLKQTKISKEKELLAAKEELKQTLLQAESYKNSFARQVRAMLINSNKQKYCDIHNNNVHIIWRLVNKDITILEKHYKGTAPSEQEVYNFKRIIENAEERGSKRPIDPVRKHMAEKGITFPGENKKPRVSLQTESHTQYPYPMFAPMFSLPMFGSAGAMFGSPGSAGAMFGSPGSAGAMFGSPGSAGPMFGSPGSAGAMFGSPGSAGVMFGSPGSAGAMFGSPGPQPPTVGSHSGAMYGYPSSTGSLQSMFDPNGSQSSTGVLQPLGSARADTGQSTSPSGPATPQARSRSFSIGSILDQTDK